MVLSRNRKLVYSALVLLLAGGFAGRQLATWPTRLLYPGEVNRTEGQRAAEMLHLAQGIAIYASPSPERFDAAIYGPLYYLLGARIVKPGDHLYLPLRIVSLLGTLGCALGCGLLAFWLGRSYLAAVLAPLFFLGYGFVSWYGISEHCDLVAVLLAFTGFLIAYQSPEKKALLLAGLFMLLSFFYKPQYVAAPLAIMVFLLLQKRYRLAAQFAGGLTVGGVAGLAVFQFVVFGSQPFLRHLLLYSVLPFSGVRFLGGAFLFGVVFLVPLLVGLEFLRVHPDKALTCYLGLAVGLCLLAMARIGSGTNYFLESLLILSALVASLVAERVREPGRVAESAVLLAVSLTLGCWLAAPTPRPGDWSREQSIDRFLRSHFAPRTPAIGSFTGLFLRAGMDTPFPDLHHYGWLIRKGVIPERHMLTNLEERRFGVLAFHFDLRSNRVASREDYFLTEALRQAILANYKLIAGLKLPGPQNVEGEPGDRFYVWVPRP